MLLWNHNDIGWDVSLANQIGNLAERTGKAAEADLRDATVGQCEISGEMMALRGP